MQAKEERIILLDKMIKKAVEARKESRRHIVSVMCFAPKEDYIKLQEALSIIEASLQNIASYHAERRRALIKGE